MGRISAEKIEEINEVYLVTGTYAATARLVGVAPSTVKKYIVPGYVSKNKAEGKDFSKEDFPETPLLTFKNLENWGDLCILNKIEKEKIQDFWKELQA